MQYCAQPCQTGHEMLFVLVMVHILPVTIPASLSPRIATLNAAGAVPQHLSTETLLRRQGPVACLTRRIKSKSVLIEGPGVGHQRWMFVNVDNEYEITAELPGMDASNVDVDGRGVHRADSDSVPAPVLIHLLPCYSPRIAAVLWMRHANRIVLGRGVQHEPTG